MHLALSIPELLACILEQLADDNATLARSAQCCKAFLDPSLNLLWAHLRSVHPLQQLLPTLYHNNGSFKQPQTKPSEDDWVRFDFYAPRVTGIFHAKPHTLEGLVLLWRSQKEISSFFCEMAALRPEVTSFPRLRELKISPGVVLHESTTWALLPPSLHSLNIQVFPSMQIVKSGCSTNPGKVILRDAARFSPFIQSLNVCGDLTPECLTYITHYKRLRALDLSASTAANKPEKNDAYHHLLHTLSISDHLVELRLSMTDVYDIPACTGFLNLEVLHIGKTASVVRRFISMIAGSKLREITISMAGEQGSYDEWCLCLEYLQTQCGASLRSINLQIDLEDGYDRSLVQFLGSIMKLGHLEHISLCIPLYASNQDVHEMASAWPKMKSFRLRYPAALEKPFHTIESLSSFAQLCPDLHSLTFEINQLGLPDVSALKMPLSHHHLKTLELVVRNNADHKQLAVILDAIFPVLENVVVNQGTISDISVAGDSAPLSGREDVSHFIREFQAKRALGSYIETKGQEVGAYTTMSRKFRPVAPASSNRL